MLFFILMVLSCQKEFMYPITAEKITDRIITYDCLDVKVAAIKTDKGLIIIDTGRSPSIMAEIKKYIEKDFNCSDYLYVINTHGHWDHVSGNQVFPDSILVGHEKCPLFMKCNPGNHITNTWRIQQKLLDLKKDAKNTKKEIVTTEIMLNDLKNNYQSTPPVITFADSLILDAGDLTLKLIYCGNAHTNNDIIIYIPEEKAVFTGDLFNMRGSYSFTMNKLSGYDR
jgi:glyoxylase-like metal-dependent hydrolase (beta-lactamase superfamily II)